MTDRIKERLQNPALGFARRTAEAGLKRAGVRLSDDFSRHPSGSRATGEVAPERPRRATGG